MYNVEESEEDIEENHLGENCIENIWEAWDSSVMLKKLHREGVKDENYGDLGVNSLWEDAIKKQ